MMKMPMLCNENGKQVYIVSKKQWQSSLNDDATNVLASIDDDDLTTMRPPRRTATWQSRPCILKRADPCLSSIANLPTIGQTPRHHGIAPKPNSNFATRDHTARKTDSFDLSLVATHHIHDTMLLPSLISLRHPASHIPTPEDIFGSTLGSIFTDDLQNQHGDDPDTTIVYKSVVYGDIELRTADVNGEEQRRKFAHYLWNAGVLMGELVGGRPVQQKDVTGDEDDEGWKNGEWWVNAEEEEKWSVKGEMVLELGAGALG